MKHTKENIEDFATDVMKNFNEAGVKVFMVYELVGEKTAAQGNSLDKRFLLNTVSSLFKCIDGIVDKECQCEGCTNFNNFVKDYAADFLEGLLKGLNKFKI